MNGVMMARGDMRSWEPAEGPDAKSSSDAKADDGGYAPVSGISRKEKEMAAVIEGKVSAKVARDYEHVVWAYAIIWVLFAAYARHPALSREMFVASLFPKKPDRTRRT